MGAQISDEKENVDRTHSDKKENVDRTRMPYGKVGTRWDFQTVWEGRNRYGYGKREAEKNMAEEDYQTKIRIRIEIGVGQKKNCGRNFILLLLGIDID